MGEDIDHNATTLALKKTAIIVSVLICILIGLISCFSGEKIEETNIEENSSIESVESQPDNTEEFISTMNVLVSAAFDSEYAYELVLEKDILYVNVTVPGLADEFVNSVANYDLTDWWDLVVSMNYASEAGKELSTTMELDYDVSYVLYDSVNDSQKALLISTNGYTVFDAAEEMLGDYSKYHLA